MNNFLDHPVFICGHRKSGTSMLVNLLDSADQAIVYPDDSGIFYLYYPRYDTDQFNRKDKLQRLASYIIKQHLAEGLTRPSQTKNQTEDLKKKCLKFANLVNTFPDKDFDFKKVLQYFIKCFSECFYPNLLNPKVWIEKTTSSEIYASELAKIFPNAKFIHILRDPRDNWASLKSGWETYYSKLNDDIRRLKQSMIERGKFGMELAKINKTILGENRYMVIRYEDLTSNPESEIKKITSFIGIPFHKKLLQQTIVGLPYKGNSFEGKSLLEPSRINIESWIKRIDEDEAMLMEYHFKDIMEEFGYLPKFNLADQQRAATEHYKWFNFSTPYSAK